MSTEREQLLSRIRHQLTTWAETIKDYNGMDLTDINVAATDICCGLLNIVLGTRLQNLNQSTRTFPGVDLGDLERRLAVEVTTTSTRNKIIQTLERFHEHRLDQHYDSLIILIIGKKQTYRERIKLNQGIYFNPDRDIWDIDDLSRKISELDMQKLRQVDTYLQEQLGAPGSSVSPSQKRTSLLVGIRRNLRDFAAAVKANLASGRTDIMADSEMICRDLLNMVYGFNLVLVNQLAKNHAAVDLVDEDLNIAVQITGSNTRSKVQHVCDRFLKQELDKQYKYFLVFILDYASPFRNVGQLFIQMTERSVDLQIKTLEDLAREIGALPLESVSAIADFLQQNVGTDTPQEQTNDTSIPMPSMQIDALPEILRQTFRLTNLLPPAGLERTVLEHGMALEQKHALVDLLHHGFLLTEASVIRVHPAFQNNPVYEPSRDECAFLLEQLWNYEDSYRWDRFTLRRKTQVVNSLAQLFTKASRLFPTFPQYAQCSAELWRDMQHYSDALKLGQQALTGFRSIKKESWDVARALHFTGECHIKLEHPELALVDWQQTLELCRNPLHASVPDLAAAYQNVGIALLEQKEYIASKAYLLRSLKMMEDMRRESKDFLTHPWMAALYDSLSAVCMALSNKLHAALCQENAILPPSEQKDLWEILVQLPPIPPSPTGDGFMGRGMELQEIDERLLLHEKVVCLSGLGGMGKTELALAFGRMYTRGMVYFVRFQESFFKTVANIGTQIDHYTVRSEEEACQLALDRLARCSDNDILIIDNVDADSGTLQDLKRDAAWKALYDMPLRLILTTRFDTDRSVGIMTMPNEALYGIFEKHGAALDYSQMDALINAVNGHTMTIDLMARTLNGKGWRNVTPDMLLKDLRNNNLSSAKYRKIATDYNLSADQAQIYHHLSVVFDVASVPEDCKAVLQYATLLPADGMYGDYFANALTEKQQEALDSLIDHGWLNAEDSLLTIPPVIRLVCQEELKPSDESCGTFLYALWKQVNSKEYDRIKFAQMAELFSNAANILEDQDAVWLNYSGRLWLDLAQPQKVKELYKRHIPLLEQRNSFHPALATAYNNIGTAFDDLGDHRKALDYKLKALVIREKVLPPDDLDLAASYGNVGITYGALSNRQKALEYQLKALAIFNKVLPADHPDIAAAYINVGYTYGNLGDYQKALEYESKALSIQEKVLPAGQPDLAASYRNIGATYGNLGDYRKELEYQLKALEICETVLPPEHPDLAASYHHAGIAYGNLGDYLKALDYLQKASRIREKVLPSDHPDLADSYNHIGHIYGYLGDHRKALDYTINALAIIEKVLPHEHPSLAASYNNVGAVYGDLGDHQKALEYKLKSLSIREKILSPSHPDLASAYNSISQTCSDLGEHHKALEYDLKALQIREKVLPPDHPDLAVSYNNIAWTYHAMGQFRDAAKYMRQAADLISRSSLPEDHPSRVNYRNWAAQMEKDAQM